MKLFPFKRTIKKGELKNVDVELISLLFDDMKPANLKGAIAKSADGKSYRPMTTSTRFKAETSGDQGRLYVTVMEPDTKDAQGDFYSRDEIQKACDHFSEKGLVSKNDINHNMQPVPEFVVAESYILKTEDKEHFPDTKIGAWVQVLKCKDLSGELWQKVKKGQFNGVSIYGKADDLGADSNAALITELKSQLETIKKALGTNPAPESSAIVTQLEKRINELEKTDTNSATNELIKSFTNEIKELSMSISKAISKSLKGEAGEYRDTDTEVMIDGNKVVLKAAHKEIYKGIAQVDAGAPMNILTPNTTSLFIDEVIGSNPSDTLTDITVVPLLKDDKIDAGVIADLVFTNSSDQAAAAQGVATADISITTGILTAEFTLGRDVVEFYKDKYGEDAFGAYVEQHIARKAEKAIRKLLFQGDRDSGTAALKALDGIIAIATDGSDVTAIDDETYITYAERFEAALLAFSEDVLEEQENFNIYVSQKDLIRLRSELAARETNAGDRLLLEGGKVSFAGIPVKARLMPDNYIVAGLTKFIIIGYRTDAELKVEHHGSDWKYHWYIRIRPGITYVDGFVKVFLVS